MCQNGPMDLLLSQIVQLKLLTFSGCMEKSRRQRPFPKAIYFKFAVFVCCGLLFIMFIIFDMLANDLQVLKNGHFNCLHVWDFSRVFWTGSLFVQRLMLCWISFYLFLQLYSLDLHFWNLNLWHLWMNKLKRHLNEE